MNQRFCEGQVSCEGGWLTIDSNGYHTCHDEPMEENCRCIVDAPQMEIREKSHSEYSEAWQRLADD